MCLGLKIELLRLTPAADFNVFAVVLADGSFIAGDVGELVHYLLLLFLKLCNLSVTLLDLFLNFVHSCHNCGDIAALFLDSGDILACGILFLLEKVVLRCDFTALHVYCKHLVNKSVHILVTGFHSVLYTLGVFADYFDIKHFYKSFRFVNNQ